MTASTQARIPGHLRRYVVEQNYDRYTAEDQAVWRFILRQLKNFLSRHAHPSYVNGLDKTGITIDRIPSIEHIDRNLEKIGWGAVPVSGFIPPAAFMEFQSIGILPIASDMRTVDHLLYTPAPDIVHEAAGHAPILADPDYAGYLRQYGAVARNAIISREDLDQYEAIRLLSDIKENPKSSAKDIGDAERRLIDVNNKMSFVSEAALLSRMNWWTAEYGLIGDPGAPRIFGAGLLSSVGEARMCLRPEVSKIPLTVNCVDFAYDITEPQPQLFVTRDFAQLGDVLNTLADRLSFRRGGEFGLKQAIKAETVNTVVLDSKIQISGRLRAYKTDPGGEPCYLQFDGPSQLSVGDRELPGQGVSRHGHGYSCPVGSLKNETRPLFSFSEADLEKIGVRRGRASTLIFASGVVVSGSPLNMVYDGNRLMLITFRDCKVTLGDEVLFDPSWGEYDMAVGTSIPSVCGGPADRERYGTATEFVAERVPTKSHTPAQTARHTLYRRIREFRDLSDDGASDRELFGELTRLYLQSSGDEWLPGVELLEISFLRNLEGADREALERHLDPVRFRIEAVKMAVQDGLALARLAR